MIAEMSQFKAPVKSTTKFRTIQNSWINWIEVAFV